MTTLRTTAILKTDIAGSTPRLREMAEADVSVLLSEHRDLVSRLAAAHDGHIVKPEGDGFWLAFPSVTAAALAAMSLQEELRFAQANAGDHRLAMRIVITLGDVLHQEGALVGDAVVLAARIEALTPPDEIYLSAAAWLAMNHAEIRTSFVNGFAVKGFAEPVAVYRIEQTHRTSVCHEFGGVVRFGAGDGFCLTFTDAVRAMEGLEHLFRTWGAFARKGDIACALNVGVHKGTLYAFRSFLHSRDLNLAFAVENATQHRAPAPGVFVTGDVRRDLAGTAWETRLDAVPLEGVSAGLKDAEIYHVRYTSARS